MFAKMTMVFLLAASCSAGHLGHVLGHGHASTGGVSSQSFSLHHDQGHDLSHHDHHHDHEESSYPKYEYKYTVNDDVTKDQKSHSESRDGDSVQGEYSFVQPDGSTRTVTYTADDHNGFQAQVSTTGGDSEYQHGLHNLEHLSHHTYH